MNDFKHIGCGDGGLIITGSAELYKRAWLCIDKCYDRIKGTRALKFCAPNYRITELQSAVAIAQLGKLKGIVARRNRLGARLSRGLAIPGVLPPKIMAGAYPTWWFYLIGVDPRILGVDGKAFAEALQAEGIPCNAGYITPVHIDYTYLRRRTAFNHSAWPFSAAKKVPPYGPAYCPKAEHAMKHCLKFSLTQWLSEREIDDCIRAAAKIAAAFRAQKRASGRSGRRRWPRR